MKRLGLWLIGVGSWGKNYIATLRDFPGAVLKRVATRNPDARSLVGPSCKIQEDWRDLLAAKDLDGVVITSSAPLHAEQLTTALEAGLPILVEKPLTLDLSQARHVLALAKAKRLPVLVDHIYLFHPAYQELKHRAKALGAPKKIVSSGGNTGPFRASVTPLWDYGPHDIAMCLDLLGTLPTKVSASASPSRGGEILKVDLTFPGGVKAALTFGNGFPVKERRFEASFAKGALLFDDLRDVPLRERRPGKTAQAVPVSAERAMNRALGAFVAAINSGAKDLSGLKLAVDVVAVLERCGEALGRRR
jgi:predicted dehydrogenase